MKVSDFIVEYLIMQGVTDIFGYPGGMVTHLMDSLGKYQNRIRSHVTYHEQAAAMAACGYAQVSGTVGVAYATSGPGATNLITGICNAYMDSIPTVFITGQVNAFEQKGKLKVRQRGFQETDIVQMVSGITKYAVRVNSSEQLKETLDEAFYLSQQGRKGPVLLDIAMNVFRMEIDPERLCLPEQRKETGVQLQTEPLEEIKKLILKAKKPVFVIGGGLRSLDGKWVKLINKTDIPVVSSMLMVDVQAELNNYYGFIGAYGHRAANFVVAKSDLVISLGARLDVRQVGAKRSHFAPNAELLRIDIDQEELYYKVHDNEYGFCADAQTALAQIADSIFADKKDYSGWVENCNTIRSELSGKDEMESNRQMKALSHLIPAGSVITTDVGQNQVWVAQSFRVKQGQKILFSGGHGAMGYSLPAAIGAYWVTGRPVYSINGDGGLQMNIQELQTVARDHIPVKIIVFNNNSLGMIRHFQEMYFEERYYQTVPGKGFSSPDFEKLAMAYRLEYKKVKNVEEMQALSEILTDNSPALVEVELHGNTYVYPKLEFGKPNQDQEPLIDRTLYERLMALGENEKRFHGET